MDVDPFKKPIVSFYDGYAINADCMDVNVINDVRDLVPGRNVPLIVADPPYGGIVSEDWDNLLSPDDLAAELSRFTRWYANLIVTPGGAIYVWGGLGKPGNRAFLRYLVETEVPGQLELANVITWAKKRAYGVQNNYLWTREECAYWVVGDAKKPRMFNIPLLDEKRGYAGYNARYPAKSEYYRRTNVWTDVTEIFRGKVHPTQKAQRVIEIPIQVHTALGEWVLDPFAGSGTTALAARALGRRWIVIEKDSTYCEAMVQRLGR